MIGNGRLTGITQTELDSRLGAFGNMGELFLTDTDLYSKALSSGVFTKVDGLNEGIKKGDSVLDGSAGEIIISKTGYYTGLISMSFGFSTNSLVDGALFINDVLIEGSRFDRLIRNVNDEGSVSISGLDVIVTNDIPATLDLRISPDSNGTLVIKHLNISVFGIG